MQTINGENRDVPTLHWVFTGSLVRNGRLAAQVTGSIVAIFHDPVALIDNASRGVKANRSGSSRKGRCRRSAHR